MRDLNKRIEYWSQAEQYRSFAAAVESLAEGADAPAWLAWVRSYADGVEAAATRGLPDPESVPKDYDRY